MAYQVVQYVDWLDENPIRSEPLETRWEADELAGEWLDKTVDFVVSHSQYTVSDDEYNEIVETEWQLIRIEEAIK